VNHEAIDVDQSAADERGGKRGAAESRSPWNSRRRRASSSPTSPRTSRLFQSTVSSVDEKTIFGVSSQMRAKSSSTRLADLSDSACGQYSDMSSYILRP
jgi:hypothetical protein